MFIKFINSFDPFTHKLTLEEDSSDFMESSLAFGGKTLRIIPKSAPGTSALELSAFLAANKGEIKRNKQSFEEMVGCSQNLQDLFSQSFNILEIQKNYFYVYGELCYLAAKGFRGRRIVLVKHAAEAARNSPQSLRAVFLQNTLYNLTSWMAKRRHTMKGFAWEVKKGPSTITLIGTAHNAFIDPCQDIVQDPQTGQMKAKSYALEPIFQDAIKRSTSLFVELNPLLHNQQLAVTNDSYNRKYHEIVECTPEVLPLLKSSPNDKMVLINCLKNLVGMDYLLTVSAEQHKLPIKELEPVNLDELALCDLYLFYSLQFVKQNGIFPGSEKSLMEYDAAQWGNLESLEEIEELDTTEMRDIQHMRNLEFTSSILTALGSNEAATFAVGAMHFVGTSGILTLLKRIDPDIAITRLEY